MQETNKFKLGLFVSVSILLFIAAVMSMGIFDSLFKAKVHMATFVEESVQGLNTGSAVKYRGVPIGNVNDITIAMGGQTIRIDMEIDLSKFKIKRGSNFLGLSSISPQDFYKYLLDDIQKGLRCRIEPDGITGLKYVEIDFFKDIAALPAEEETPGLQNGIFYLPSTPSLMANLRISMTEILANIASINFKKISRETISLLSTANSMVWQFAYQPQLVHQLTSFAC